MSTYEALKYNFNGSALTNIVSIEVGTILPWSNSSLPSGYLNCDGTAVSRTTYSALFAVIGTDYGSGNGSSTFNLPDLQDKVPLGVSNTKAVASSGGAASVTPAGSISIGAITPAGSVSIGAITPAGSVTIDAITPSGNLSMSSITPSGNVGGSTGNTTISIAKMPSHTHTTTMGIGSDTNATHARDFGNSNLFQRRGYETLATGGSGSHNHNMSANFSGNAVTPTGNFSGSSVTPTGSFSGNSVTPSGTFSGNSVTPSGSFSGNSLSTLQPYVAVKFMIKT